MTRAEENDDDADRLRIDRWLWCARLFKSRSAAADAVRGGHVRLNGQRVKPAHAVKIGDALQIASSNGAEREVAIALIPKRRGPAPEAAASYIESPLSIERRRKAAALFVEAPDNGQREPGCNQSSFVSRFRKDC